MPERKLLAVDTDGLQIISALLQDAIVRVGDMRLSGTKKNLETGEAPSGSGGGQFSAVLNRFDWELVPGITSNDAASDDVRSGRSGLARRLSGLRIDKVEGARVKGIDLKASEVLLNLLAIRFDETDAPKGTLTLEFAAGGSIALDVECVEAAMGDLGPEWRTRNLPGHGDDVADGQPARDEPTGKETSGGDAEMT